MRTIETYDELMELKSIVKHDMCVCFPMWVDNSKHPYNTKLSFIFVVCGGTEYIVSVHHTDMLPLKIDDITDVFNDATEIWSFQKKKFIQSLSINGDNVNDVDSAYFLKNGKVIEYDTILQPVMSILTRHGYKDDLIQSLPILKLCETIRSFINNISIDNTNYSYNWYDKIFIPTLSQIEKWGVGVDRKKFTDSFSHSSKHISPNSRVYTEYNPFTVTGRPSNRHGGVNFSALNKSDGSRDCFVADGIFLQMDYDAYHPRIIGKLIGYELPKTSVHQWLADQYGCEYGEGKGITFRLLYGGIPDEFRQIEYYDKVAEYIEKLWGTSKQLGYLQTRYRRIPLDWIEDATPQKVFNYLLQAMETELNMDMLAKILKYIDGTGIRISLYVYDSFLFDVPLDCDKSVLLGLRELIESGGFPVKTSWGENYGKV
jgi:hypothetical protein